ncbi:MAG TPA: transposase [Steroidobacteraceae bacterium]|jgi:transposase-like protein|nr:transposase [Steroidobacteraceae bacterium]
MARRSKFTPATGARICKLVALGVTLDAAAGHEGVSKQTVYNWRDQGRAGRTGGYVTFAKQLHQALSKAEVQQTKNVIAMGKRDWKASAWWLERRRPEVYGDRSKIEHHLMGEVERVLDVAKATLPAGPYAVLLGALSKPDSGAA